MSNVEFSSYLLWIKSAFTAILNRWHWAAKVRIASTLDSLVYICNLDCMFWFAQGTRNCWSWSKPCPVTESCHRNLNFSDGLVRVHFYSVKWLICSKILWCVCLYVNRNVCKYANRWTYLKYRFPNTSDKFRTVVMTFLLCSLWRWNLFANGFRWVINRVSPSNKFRHVRVPRLVFVWKISCDGLRVALGEFLINF